MANHILYCTFTQNGRMRRAVLSQKQYDAYRKDSTIQNLQIHGSQNLMETFFNESNGINKPVKQLLYG